jgi:hypothetical protein
MTSILIGGDDRGCAQLERWLAAWGLSASRLGPDEHPAAVSASRARAVVYACSPDAVDSLPAVAAPTAAPLVLVGHGGAGELERLAWDRVTDPGPSGENLAVVLRPCLDASPAVGCGGPGFRDFLNHELRTPLTAAGMALQTLALHLESAGGPSLDLVDTALRNIQRLEQTVEWATDYVAEEEPTGPGVVPLRSATLTDLLADLDEIGTSLTLSWSTGVGDWQAEAALSREDWRRLLRQSLRALAYLQDSGSVHLQLSLSDSGPGLMLVFEVERVAHRGDLAASDDEQLRRLVTFTVHPELARRLELRSDVVRTSDSLRLRMLLPAAVKAPAATGSPAAALQPA